MSADVFIVLEFENGTRKHFEPPKGQYVEGGDGVCIDLSSLPHRTAKIHVTMNPYFEVDDEDDGF